MNQKLLLSSLLMIVLIGTISIAYATNHNSIESVNVVENKLVSLIGIGFDVDDDNLKYTWAQIHGEVVELSSYSEAEPTFMAPDVTNGKILVLTFKLTVTDALGANSSDVVEVIVNPVNHAPTVNAGKDKLSIFNIHAMSIFPTVHDIDGDDLTYEWRQISGQEIKVESLTTKHLTFHPMSIDYRIFDFIEFQLIVRDGFGGVGSDNVKIWPYVDVKENKRISIKVTPFQSVDERDTVTMSVTGSTLDEKPIRYTWSQINTPLVQLSSNQGQSVTFVAPEIGDIAKLLTFQVTGYSQGNGYAQTTAFVNVLPSNNSPIVDAGPDKNTPEKKLVKLNGSATDLDGDSLKFNWSQVSGIPVEIYERSDSSVYFFAPDVSIAQQLVFELKASDKHGGVGFDRTNVNVNYVNSPPRAMAGEDIRVITGNQVRINGIGIDVDGDELTYKWTQVYGDKVLFASTNPSLIFMAPDVDSPQTKRLSFEFTVTDTYGQTGVDRVVIFVVPENSPPFANAGADITVGEGTVIELVCIGNDPDFDKLSYSWSSPDVQLGPVTASVFSYKTFNVVNDTTVTLICEVTDGKYIAYDEMNLTVTNVLSLDIIANAGPDRMVNENVRINLDARKTVDPENQEIFYHWTQISGEIVELSSRTSPLPSFITPVVENGKIKVLVFELTVSDRNGRSHSDSVTITVDPINSPPQASASARQ